MAISIWVGIGLGSLCACSLVACIATFFAVFNLALVQKTSPVYLISLTNICSDIIWISLYLIFLVPSIIANKWLYPGQRGEFFSNLIGFLINNCWYTTSFLQILMAINRLFVICFYRKKNIFSFRVLRILAPLMIPLASIQTLIQQEILPCCRMSLDPSHGTYGFELIPNVTNYSNLYLAFPTNLITSSTAICCYSFILIYVRQQSSAIRTVAKKTNELIYAVQFCAISMFHLFAWTSVRFLPGFIANVKSAGAENLYSISAFMIICDASANSFVYLIFNTEVHEALKKKRFLTREVPSSVHTI